ncbi:unnamed protein product [marine sediment metagenome]|uniref:Uncharacterized protein n=1 Tax=marine sediment metagenome TaxID=412755 RepID=X1BPG1_9ZZZZ
MATYFTVDQDGNVLSIGKTEVKNSIKMTENMDYPVEVLEKGKTRTIKTSQMRSGDKILRFYRKHEIVFRNGKFKVKEFKDDSKK